LLRAWKGLHRFEGRGSVRSWLYSIATNTALDMLKHRSRRELPTGFGPAAPSGAPLAEAVTDPVWLEPYPDRWLNEGPPSPEARYEQRESAELAFMVMLQKMPPPPQRAALILRDVMGFSAAEVAGQLGTSVAAVNSAGHRATVRGRHGGGRCRHAARHAHRGRHLVHAADPDLVPGPRHAAAVTAFLVMEDPGRAGFFARFGLPAEINA
jgi:RNA polymerase sigma-70 factor (ECF subfamily)